MTVLYPETEGFLSFYFFPVLIGGSRARAMEMYYEKTVERESAGYFSKVSKPKRGTPPVKGCPSPAVTASHLYLLSQSLQLPLQV